MNNDHVKIIPKISGRVWKNRKWKEKNNLEALNDLLWLFNSFSATWIRCGDEYKLMSKDLYGNFELVRSLLCFVSLVLRVSNVLFIQSDGSPHTTCYSKLCLGFWAMTCTKGLMVPLFRHVKMLLFSGFFPLHFVTIFELCSAVFCVILYLFFTHGSSCPLNPPKKNLEALQNWDKNDDFW